MPHVSIEYSSNIDRVVDVGAFCSAIRDACLETGVFPFAGIRVRATRVDHFVIADGDPDHMFMDISVRLRGGRDLETRKSATTHIFTAAKEFLAPVIESEPIALSFEMRDIDPDLSPKLNTVRDRLQEAEASS
ncbi:MAG: 5-carboxymethyl-2-hydroxymuconate Delta-isomerase [Methyloligellaceae bacterium]